VTFNLSKRGASVSPGPKGAHITVGTSGVTETVGAPGTGLFWPDRQSWRGRRGAAANSASSYDPNWTAKLIYWLVAFSVLTLVAIGVLGRLAAG
jgi:hypothetical protein